MGLALSDSLGVTARPLEVIERSNRRGDIARLREICRRHAVGRLLVGSPLHLDGTVSEMAREAERFAERLRRDLRLPVELVDERLTSWEAHQALDEIQSQRRRGRATLRTANRGARRAPEAIDDLAAAVILRDYLSRARRGSTE
jgi:putative Holliday junction resolvase